MDINFFKKGYSAIIRAFSLKKINSFVSYMLALFMQISSIKSLRLHATICRVRFVFWRIKMSAGAIIHCRFVKMKFQM
jgi:hypothetical protein